LKKNKRTAVLDTNLLVRYLTEDEPLKAEAVERLLNRAAKGEVRLVTPAVVVAELVWVLESYYKMAGAQIADLVDSLLQTSGLEVQDHRLIRRAVAAYRENKIDFVDAWIMAFARQRSVNLIYSYDKKHFKTGPDLEVRQPE
jgi:predicted nucleic-acid-binding protein